MLDRGATLAKNHVGAGDRGLLSGPAFTVVVVRRQYTMVRSLIAVLALLLGVVSDARAACEGQAGTTIFDDNFADDSGGWELTTWKVQPPVIVGDLTPQFTSNATLNTTFNATDGDYCTEVQLPAAPVKDNPVSAGLLFLGTDYNNIFLALIGSNGLIALYKRVSGNYSVIYTAQDSNAVNTTPDSVNAIRVTVKEGKITLFVNGKQLKVVRAQIPTGPLRFGMYVQVDKAVQSQVDVDFKSYKVTSGQ
jgi:hypothetical protein